MAAVWDAQVQLYPVQGVKKACQAEQKKGGSAVKELGSGHFMVAVLDERAALMVALAYQVKEKKKAHQLPQTLQQVHQKKEDSAIEGMENGWFMEVVLDVKAACPEQGVKKVRLWE